MKTFNMGPLFFNVSHYFSFLFDLVMQNFEISFH